jgi:5-methyltetrahydropteroyltriglutamate--homocysteine methyltransferase
MKPSADRILTTHVGSLPQPRDLLDLMKAKVAGLAYGQGTYNQRVKSAVAECVRKQVETGIDIFSDGAQSNQTPQFVRWREIIKSLDIPVE